MVRPFYAGVGFVKPMSWLPGDPAVRFDKHTHNAFTVDFVTEAALTFPMTHAGSGVTFSAQDIKTRTELVLQDRFARVVDVDTCLAKQAATTAQPAA